MGRRELFVDIVGPVAIIAVAGVALVLVTGVWPPMVAVESGSMEPNAFRGDLIVISEPTRFPGSNADANGLVTAEAAGDSYGRLGGPGDVIVFLPPDREGPPIFHRIAFAVEAGENWHARADERYHDAGACADLANCPAPHAGYITIGDNNARYDQAENLAPPVKPSWIVGKAQLRIPNAGWLRLVFEERVEEPQEPATQTRSTMQTTSTMRTTPARQITPAT